MDLSAIEDTRSVMNVIVLCKSSQLSVAVAVQAYP